MQAEKIVQENVFGGTRIQVRKRLEEWNGLYRKYAWLQRQLLRDQEALERVRLTLPSMTQIPDDMPKASGVSDKVGNYVAKRLDLTATLLQSIEENKLELEAVETKLMPIEDAVSQLDRDSQDIIRRFYRDRLHWSIVVAETFASKNKVYRRIDRVLDMLVDILGKT